jgi:hypothetical protein
VNRNVEETASDRQTQYFNPATQDVQNRAG